MKKDFNQSITKASGHVKKKIGTTSIWIFSFFAHTIIVSSLIALVFSQVVPKESSFSAIQLMPIDNEVSLIEEIVKIQLVKEKNILNMEQEEKQMPQDLSIASPELQEIEYHENAEKIQEPELESFRLVRIISCGTRGFSNKDNPIIENPFESRSRSKKISCLFACGSKRSETSVDLSLWWLANHQEKDGHWDSAKYEGLRSQEADCADTGMALLAFLGTNQTDKVGKWKSNVKNAINWLIANQKPNGSWDDRNYANGICTLAMVEAAGMKCGNMEVKRSAENAVEYLLKQQNDTGCFNYSGPSDRNDMSITGWCIMAFKSAMICDIKKKEIKESFQKCRAFLDSSEGTKDNSSSSKGLAWYIPSTLGTGAMGGACQAIAMLIRQYTGEERSSPWLQAAADGQITKIPLEYKNMDVYRIYYSFLTLFQLGGNHWQAWYKPVTELIVSAQRQDGDFKGSWDKTGCHVDKGGRVLYTALLCLCLEVPYRYELIK